MPQVRRSYGTLAVCGLLLLAVIAVFGQTASHDFVNFDDNDYVYENQHVRGGPDRRGTAWAITAYYSANWHPLTWLSHMLDCQLYGLKPGGHHLTNVLLHAAAAILLFLALQRMTGALWPSAWVAAVFADPSPAGRIGRLGSRAQGRIERAVLHVDTLVLRILCRSPGIVGPVLVGGGLVCPGPDRQADAGDVALRASLAGLLAAGEAGSWERGAKACWHEAQGCCSSLLALVVEKIPLFVLAAASCLVTLAAQCEAMQPLEQLTFAGRLPMPSWPTSLTSEKCFVRPDWRSSIRFPRTIHRPGK